MELTDSGLLDKVRGLAAARELIDRAIAEVVCEALAAGVNRAEIADALGVHRSTLYRQYEVGDAARPGELFTGSDRTVVGVEPARR